LSDFTLLNTPKQDRSRETTNRILDALELLLRDRPFSRISVRDVLRASGTSTGSFYARFPTREAMLPVLYERYDAQLHREHAKRTATVARGGPPTKEELTRAIIGRQIARLRANRWLMHAVAIHARTHPELVSLETRERRQAALLTMHGGFLRFRDRITHPDPEAAVAFGLFMVLTTSREKVVFGDAPLATSVHLDDEQLIDELTRALLAYLGVTPHVRSSS
jgi:AcrR family transcriptional regulator